MNLENKTFAATVSAQETDAISAAGAKEVNRCHDLELKSKYLM